ncbi:hypothetical protein MmiAt1_15300 [Methanimicrococcus sp. At1]|uniref:Beta propeller domain protein n=1 Tax=Methanimicrococcus hacksteinii TaxID=3028293 RepID=A0ABU3VR88_9EURY|nr:beta-propeller domain-containing protein [Methanimicrococcus sp. At1]MDV0445927.1 hypothetical protein [Methanimicrococcus sp. At1]
MSVFKSVAVLLLCSLFIAVSVSGCLSSGSSDLDKADMKSFSSESEMEEYFNTVYYSDRGNLDEEQYYSNLYSGSIWPSRNGSAGDVLGAVYSLSSNTTSSPNAVPESVPTVYDSSEVSFVSRYSETNVHTAGIDEADLVKTDGKTIYYTPENYYPYQIREQTDYRRGDVYYSYSTERKTFAIDALPPESAAILSEINLSGDLYLINNTLVAIHYNLIKGYDVTDPSAPEKIWEKQLWGYYADSKMIDGKLYLVVLNHTVLSPMKYMGQTIDYKNVYYPTNTNSAVPQTDTVYYLSEVDMQDGSFDQTVALIGSESSIIYGSENALYLTNHYTIDEDLMYLQYMKDQGADFYPEIKKEILEIVSYDAIRPYLRAWGVRDVVSNYTAGLNLTEQQMLFNLTHNDYLAYSYEYVKKAEQTSITKVDLNDFSINTGSVPGLLLNSFSMDESGGYLRVAASSSDSWMIRENSFNSVYVLDGQMKIAGKLENLAPGETIYSSRFTGDILYLVTYRVIDPFFVIDLSNPKSPELLGELKIPGYSTYLHPINDTAVIGLGKADNNAMKLTLFDVTNPDKPIETDSYVFDSNVYSAADHDYHAFRWDGEKGLLVIPTYEHAFVFKVDESGIELKFDDVHEGGMVSRTIYINDYFYTFSNKAVHIINQNSWEIVKIIDIPLPELNFD